MEMPKPQKEHEWLQKLVGEWTVEGEAMMGPDQLPTAWKGTEQVRALGEVWILAEGRSDAAEGCDGDMTTMMTLGYDEEKKQFVGTFVASMMTCLWVYNGSLDATGRVLTLDTEGPNMAAEGTTAKYQDVIEIISDDHRMLTSRMSGEDGQWRQFMMAHYRRKT